MDDTPNGEICNDPGSPTQESEGDFDDDLGFPYSYQAEQIDGKPLPAEIETVSLLVEDVKMTSTPVQDEKGSTDLGIPFYTIHNEPEKFSSHSRRIFIPKREITVTISDCERNHTTHLMNPNLYTISFSHGDFTWQVKKRYKHISELHQQLLVYRATVNIRFPTTKHKRNQQSFRNNTQKNENGKRKAGLPRFPKKPEILVMYDQLNNRIKQIEDYLYNLLQITVYRNHPATIEFLEVSHLSFVKDLGFKWREGMLKKRSGSTQPGQSGCDCLGCYQNFCCIRFKNILNDVCICSMWNKRWIFLKDTCFGYMNPRDGRVSAVILFDQGFEVSSGMYSRGLHKGMQIVTLSRQLMLKCPTRTQRKSWVESFKEVANSEARDFTKSNRHLSFAPIRNNIQACWFVDGEGYMSAVADAIQNAKEEVFITDWWLSPEIYLKRPAIEGDYWRLDRLLQRKANEGVKIFILLYKEFEMALGLNSLYTKQTLQNDNIKVLRHPDHTKIGVFLWAHHEKIVVVDQIYAFLGGVDLCYGRWDTHEHRLTDFGSATPTININNTVKKTSSTPGGEKIYPIPTPAYKLTPQPEIQVKEVDEEESNHSEKLEECPYVQPGDYLLMPPSHQNNIPNTPETQRKNKLFSRTAKIKGKEMVNMVYSPNESTDEDVCDSVISNTNKDLSGSAKLWIGKDYCNFIVKDFVNLDAPFADFIDRNTTPRMPWHDIACCVQGAAARDVARHFIQRWNATKLEKAKFNTTYPYLLPKSYQGLRTFRSEFLQLESHRVTCQILRSVSTWSCGFVELDTIEQSIHTAYVDAINKAEHYIYIENQFFISLPHGNPNTRNQIAETLFKRIVKAHKENAKFRVYVVMPLLPGFEGEVGGQTGTSLRAITHWNYASISRGGDSLIERLKMSGIEDPSEYISFYGLRTHSCLNGEPITELIYVHSKLMIVDDRLVICGSANINDRSLLGKRDSEIAVVIEDDEFDQGTMNGMSYPSGKYAGSLRRQIFKEHLGILGKEHERIDVDVTDPVSDRFYRDTWLDIAKLNTEMYEKVFHCIPTDQVETFAALKDYQTLKPLYTCEIAQAEKMLETVSGHIVMLPLNFLRLENLTPSSGTVESMMPTTLWT